MDAYAFAASVVALLILPGPTNAVLAMASHGLSLSRMGVLLVAVILTYLAVIVPVSLFGGPFLQQHPAVSQGVKLASATWMFYLASKLWGRPSRQIQLVALGVRQVVATTLLNPKAIIIALAMLPSRGILAPDVFLSFVVAAGGTSCIWLSIGRLVLGDGDQMPLAARRCSSAVLFGFCVLLTVSAF
ncbi:threonine/homoserine/homoserine lactone efflux protein [Rhizobium mesoamericanum]|nr:threonine/homoserine/homoserine lactone efflux protein [Rhizobium mesoamericanum]